MATTAAAAGSIRRLAARLATGSPAGAGGVWGSCSALVTAALDRPAVVLVPGEPAEFADDLALFGAPAAVLPESDAGDLAFAERVRAVHRFLRGEVRCLVASSRAALQGLPPPQAMEATRVTLAVGSRESLDRLSRRFVESRYERTHAVERAGEYAIRGGILDVFPYTAERPVRLEFFGDTIESIREFDVSDQAATAVVESAEWSLLPEADESGSLEDHLAPEMLVVVREPEEIRERLRHLQDPSRWESRLQQFFARLGAHPVLTIRSLPAPEDAGVNLGTLSLQRFSGELSNVAREIEALPPGPVVVFCANEGEEERLRGLLKDAGVVRADLEIRQGRLARGFIFPEAGFTAVSNHELFNRYRMRRGPGRRSEGRAIDSLLELEKGDTVVHIVHGIGRFLGIERLEQGEFVTLEYADGARIYVPVANIDLIQKYLGGGDAAPPLHKVGGGGWTAAMAKAEKATEKLAQELLQVQAVREMELGFAFPADTDWQRAFEAAFPYEDTEDQAEVSKQVKLDLQAAKPMDRLICGDVGYGKTEIAMRAAFKVATAAKQVAVLVPTTVLAQQHYKSFTERMKDYPVSIEVISRFKSKADQQKILKRVAAGEVDIVIGTHRLVQHDVKFRDLGLVVIDEEQRFGVEHKERLKRMRATVDVLTLTATPIPRTMHLSLLGVRDISTLATPPQDRMSVRTEVMIRNDRRIREGILAELERGGQVYFVHNRVYSIDAVKRRLERLVPEASFGVGHGQMDEERLERTMVEFLDGKIDVLVATTIIESGLDIPNVNTIFIDNADQFGLADLHQLRGRVGRYKVQAHCALLLPPDRPVLPQAQKRIKVVEEFSELGSGLKIAMRDLEIRGVGNLLGREQHGHIAAVGYDMYLKMLERSVKKMKKVPFDDLPDAGVELGVEASVPERYIGDLRSRVEVYRRIAGCRTVEELEGARREVADRFGPLPEPVETFVHVVRVRQLAQKWRFTSVVKVPEGFVAVTFLDRTRAEALRKRNPKDIRIVDAMTLHIHGAGSPQALATLLE